jgi:hypothetical protein
MGAILSGFAVVWNPHKRRAAMPNEEEPSRSLRKRPGHLFYTTGDRLFREISDKDGSENHYR